MDEERKREREREKRTDGKTTDAEFGGGPKTTAAAKGTAGRRERKRGRHSLAARSEVFCTLSARIKSVN